MSVINNSQVLKKSEARIATPTPSLMEKVNLRNFHLIIDVTAATATPSVQVAIEGLDPASGDFYELLPAIAAITATGTTVLKLGESIVAAAGLAADDFIPETIRISYTHADTDSITYSVGMNYQEYIQ